MFINKCWVGVVCNFKTTRWHANVNNIYKLLPNKFKDTRREELSFSRNVLVFVSFGAFLRYLPDEFSHDLWWKFKRNRVRELICGDKIPRKSHDSLNIYQNTSQGTMSGDPERWVVWLTDVPFLASVVNSSRTILPVSLLHRARTSRNFEKIHFACTSVEKRLTHYSPPPVTGINLLKSV